MCSLFVALSVKASGISVKPDALNFHLKAKQTQTNAIVVENISAKPVIYNLYADELEDMIFLAPTNFRLEPGQKRQVKVLASPKQAGLFATNLSVVTQDLDRRTFNVATGVKIPLVMRVEPAPVFILPAWAKKAAVALLIPGIAWLAYWLVLLKRKQTWWNKIINLFKKI